MELRSGYFNLNLQMFYLFFVADCRPFLQKKKYFLRKPEKTISKGGHVPFEGSYFFVLHFFQKLWRFPRKPRKTVSVGVRRMQPPKLPLIFFLSVYTGLFLAISRTKNGYSNHFDFLQYSSVSQKFYLAFLQFDSSRQNRFLIDKRNFLSKKLIFPPSL